MKFYVECPFYLKHKTHSTTIVCEDSSREFYTREARDEQIDKVCEKNWSDCPYAAALITLYERTENMNLTAKEREHLQHTCESQKTELAKIRRQYKKLVREQEQMERDIKAYEYLVDSKDRRIKDMEGTVFLLEQKQQGFLALIGYMSALSGIKDFTLNQVRRFGRTHDTVCRVDTVPGADGIQEITRVYVDSLSKPESDEKADKD